MLSARFLLVIKSRKDASCSAYKKYEKCSRNFRRSIWRDPLRRMHSYIEFYVTNHRTRAWNVFLSIRFVEGNANRAPPSCIEMRNFLNGIATISFLITNQIYVSAGFQSVQEISWDFMQGTLVVTDVSGKPVGSICPLKIGPTGL